MRDLRQELAGWNGWPSAWGPDVGDILVGTVEQYAQGHTQYGAIRTVIVRDEETGETVSIWLSSTVLLDVFRRERPAIGERIALKYLGKHPTRGYHRYHLIVDREPAFDPLGGEDADDDNG